MSFARYAGIFCIVQESARGTHSIKQEMIVKKQLTLVAYFLMTSGAFASDTAVKSAENLHDAEEAFSSALAHNDVADLGCTSGRRACHHEAHHRGYHHSYVTRDRHCHHHNHHMPYRCWGHN